MTGSTSLIIENELLKARIQCLEAQKGLVDPYEVALILDQKINLEKRIEILESTIKWIHTILTEDFDIKECVNKNYNKPSQCLSQRFGDLSEKLEEKDKRIKELETAIKNHRAQKVDDKCWMDDDVLYSVLNDGIKADYKVGCQEEMLKNCARYIQKRTEDGEWPTYAELEQKIKELEHKLNREGSEI